MTINKKIKSFADKRLGRKLPNGDLVLMWGLTSLTANKFFDPENSYLELRVNTNSKSKSQIHKAFVVGVSGDCANAEQLLQSYFVSEEESIKKVSDICYHVSRADRLEDRLDKSTLKLKNNDKLVDKITQKRIFVKEICLHIDENERAVYVLYNLENDITPRLKRIDKFKESLQ